jgi:hypothetical protein
VEQGGEAKMDGSFEELRVFILESIKELKTNNEKQNEQIGEIMKGIKQIEIELSNWKGRIIALTSIIAIAVSIIVPIIIEKIWK